MLRWYGGKGSPTLSKWLFKNFDLNGINNYVEPFSGMFGIYLSKHTDFSKVMNIVYNDIDLQNVNIFNCSQMPMAFLEKINYAFKPNGMFFCSSCEEFDDYLEFYKSIYLDYKYKKRVIPEVNLEERNFEAAFIYSFLRMAAYGQMHYFQAGFRPDIQRKDWYKRSRFFQPIVNKLKDIPTIDKVARIKEITANDFEEVMSKYNTSDSFIYLDPPYYDHESFFDAEKKDVFTIEDHERLAKAVNNSKARIAISYYQFPEMADLYPVDKFIYKKRRVRSGASGKKETEILIMNY
jgi:DNA adenine methylase